MLHGRARRGFLLPQTTRCRAIALGSKEELRGQHSQYWLVCRQPGLGRTSRRSLPAETARSGRRQFKQDYKRTDSTTPANDWPVSSIVMASRALATRSPTSGGKSTTPSRAVSMSISNSSGVKAVASARTSISWRRLRFLGGRFFSSASSHLLSLALITTSARLHFPLAVAGSFF